MSLYPVQRTCHSSSFPSFQNHHQINNMTVGLEKYLALPESDNLFHFPLLGLIFIVAVNVFIFFVSLSLSLSGSFLCLKFPTLFRHRCGRWTGHSSMRLSQQVY